MPLFVTKSSVGAPAKTEFAKQDYPICFNTADNNIYVYNSALSDVKTFSGNNTITKIYTYTNPPDNTTCTLVSPTSHINIKGSNNQISLTANDSTKTITIGHSMIGTPTNSGSSTGYLITTITTNSYGHLISYTKTTAGIKDIVTRSSSLPSNPDSNTLYLIT